MEKKHLSLNPLNHPALSCSPPSPCPGLFPVKESSFNMNQLDTETCQFPGPRARIYSGAETISISSTADPGKVITFTRPPVEMCRAPQSSQGD